MKHLRLPVLRNSVRVFEDVWEGSPRDILDEAHNPPPEDPLTENQRELAHVMACTKNGCTRCCE